MPNSSKLPLLVCVGRVAVDLYGEEFGASLAESRRFVRYLGGTSGNLAVGAARLGLQVEFAGGVGADPMGEFVRRTLVNEGVGTRALVTRPDRRTALAFLGMLGAEAVGLDFYRELAADAEVSATPELLQLVRHASALALCGSHLADPVTAERLASVIEAARSAGAAIILDLDLRPALWSAMPGGLAGASARVAAAARNMDLVVGNEEEFTQVTGIGAPFDESRQLRTMFAEGVVLKRGHHGAAWLEPEEGWICEAGLCVPVLNPVGAGDAFLAGFLSVHLTGGTPAAALARGNTCGALVVTRHGCSDAMPFPDELAIFAKLGCGNSLEIQRLHRSGKRRARPHPVLALACDHRVPFAELSANHGRSHQDVAHFKALVADAARNVAQAHGRHLAMLMDATYGSRVLESLGRDDAWIGRPVEVTGSRPLRFEAGPDLAQELRRWHPLHVAKCLVWHHPDDPEDIQATQLAQLRLLQSAAEGADIEWILEAVPPLDTERSDATLVRSVEGLYAQGLRPDYWKLPALSTESGWRSLQKVIEANDPRCRGVLTLGLDLPLGELSAGLTLAGTQPVCAGFAVGRSIFGAAARDWFAGRLDDAAAVRAMADAFGNAVDAFLAGHTVANAEATVER